MREGLSSQERIRKRKEFILVYKLGSRYRGKYFNLIYLSNNLTFSRMAVVASKKVGNAVKRNKVKRWLRDLFRRNKDLLKSSLDIIVIAKKEIQDASWLTLKEQYISAVNAISKETRS